MQANRMKRTAPVTQFYQALDLTARLFFDYRTPSMMADSNICELVSVNYNVSRDQ